MHTWHDVDAGYAVLLENGNLLALSRAEEKNPRFHGPGVSGGLLQERDWDGERGLDVSHQRRAAAGAS